jgi:hypothetical protein
VIADPITRGRTLAEFYFRLESALWNDLEGSRVLPSVVSAQARDEWSLFALYACVRGLVAAGGFNTETVAAVDAMHEAVRTAWGLRPEAAGLACTSRPAVLALLSARYAEYGRIGQELEASGAALVTQRLGEAAAAHVSAPEPPSEALETTLGGLHEALAEGAADAVRAGIASAPHPPLALLQDVSARLTAAGVVHALGTSGLLFALGLVDHANDWDLTCECSLETLQEVFASEPQVAHGNSGIHADHKLQLHDGAIELIARYAFFSGPDVIRIPTLVAEPWNGVPLGMLEPWAAAYWLMGHLEDVPRRRERADLVFRHLLRHGADAAALERVLAEPLPEALATRLRALPRRAQP